MWTESVECMYVSSLILYSLAFEWVLLLSWINISHIYTHMDPCTWWICNRWIRDSTVDPVITMQPLWWSTLGDQILSEKGMKFAWSGCVALYTVDPHQASHFWTHKETWLFLYGVENGNVSPMQVATLSKVGVFPHFVKYIFQSTRFRGSPRLWFCTACSATVYVGFILV